MAQERPPLEEMTLRQLRRVASEYNISRYSRMRKSQLLASVEQAIQTTTPNKNPLISFNSAQEEQRVEASKFELGQDDRSGGPFTDVDEELGDFPGGYGESRIVLMPRDPQWAYAYWDIPHDNKEALRRQGGQQLALRLYDVTGLDINNQSPHSVQEYLCDEMAREWYLPLPVSDRDYAVDIGYRTFDGRWLTLARSTAIRVPPVYPSDWVEDVYVTVNWDEDLRGKTVYQLVSPSQRPVGAPNAVYDQVFEMAQDAEAQRQAGSLYGSMQHVPASVQHVPASMAPQQSISSYIFPSGMGLWAVPNVSGLRSELSSEYSMSGVGMGYSMSGVGYGYGYGLSSAEFMASQAPVRPRQFWLVADAELIVYGATEPDATVTIGGQPIKLNADGTFRFQMSFQDGLIDYPIMAVAVDGEQTRSIHMKFNRETPSRNTNKKEDAVVEWLV